MKSKKTIRRLTPAAVVVAGVIALGGVGLAAANTNHPSTPETSQTVFALTTDHQLVSFNHLRPNVIMSQVAVSGVGAGEHLLGIDFRPANGKMYAVSSASQLYVIDHRTGVAAKVGMPFSPVLDSHDIGFDFNPAVDRIRITTSNGQDLRIHPDTGALVAVDGRLTYSSRDPRAGWAPSIAGSAYTNPDNNPATGTVLYNIDARFNTLVTQDPPNDGILNTVGYLGVDTTAMVGFDISQSNEAIAALQHDWNAAPVIYLVDLRTGKAWERGQLFTGQPVRDITIFNNAAHPYETR